MDAAIRFIVTNPLRQNRMLSGSRGAVSGPRRRRSRACRVPRRVSRRFGAHDRAAEPGPETDSPSLDPRRPGRKGQAPAGRLAARGGPGSLRRARPDRGRGRMEPRGGLRGRGGGDRRAPARPPGPGLALRVRPRRAPRQEGRRQAGRRGASDPEGRNRRRRPDGEPTRDAVPPAPRSPDRDQRPRPGDRRPRRRLHPRRAREPGPEGQVRRGQGPLPRIPRRGRDDIRPLRRLRPRPRSGLRGDVGEAAGLRGAGGRGLARDDPRHKHLLAVRGRDGGQPRAPRARRRAPLLQPGRRPPARRDHPHARDGRRSRSRPPGRPRRR